MYIILGTQNSIFVISRATHLNMSSKRIPGPLYLSHSSKLINLYDTMDLLQDYMFLLHFCTKMSGWF